MLTIGLNRAVSLLAEERPKGRGKPEPMKTLGNHPETGDPVHLMNGRYGPYVAHGGINATLPRGVTPEQLTLERGLELLAEKAAKGPSPKRRAPARKKAAAK